MKPLLLMWKRLFARRWLAVLCFLRDTSNPLSPHLPRLLVRINSQERRTK